MTRRMRIALVAAIRVAAFSGSAIVGCANDEGRFEVSAGRLRAVTPGRTRGGGLAWERSCRSTAIPSGQYWT